MCGANLGIMRRHMTWEDVRRHLPGQYLWPMLLLVGVCFSCFAGVLIVTTMSQDDLQQSREHQGLETAIESARNLVVRDLQDYAKWDDAVRHLSYGVDSEWMNDNVVAYLGVTQGYNYIAALDPSNRTVFLSCDGGACPIQDARPILGEEFARAILKARHLSRTGLPVVGGISRSGNQLFVYAIGQVVPLTGKVALPKGPVSLLVIAKRIDATFLARIAREQRLQNLELRLDTPPAGSSVSLGGQTARLRAWLTWVPSQPGTQLRRQALQLFLLVTLAAVAVAGLVIRRGARNVEALRLSEARARYQALHDALTGLPNRRALIERLGAALASDSAIQLLYMDLDGFKDANDLYGHAVGDTLLRQAGQRIAAAVPGAFVARAGGDEFAILLEVPVTGCDDIADKIIAAFGAPFATGDSWAELGVSIGCVDRPPGSRDDEDAIMRHADAAMYAAKAEGKRCWRSYRSEMDQHHQLRVQLEADLRAAIERGQIDVVYQPVVNAHTKEIQSVEALARWHHPRHGAIPPDIFIPLAERSGLIGALGRSVLRRSCHDIDPLGVGLAVNLSPAQFWDHLLVDQVLTALKESGFPARRLELEITETFLLRRPEAAADILRQLRSIGISIALDDFGTGFASIGYLRQLSFDRLKIDKQFIAPLTNRGPAADLVQVITSLGRLLDLEVTAEGVETSMQAELARQAGCSQLQGFLFGQPMSLDELIAHLARCPRRDAA
jgi:diguanylate cyclase (GGDEF)-like protein